MIDARITEIRFKPGPRSRWAGLRVGMTVDEAVVVLGSRPNDRSNLYYRVRCGDILFDLPPPQRGIVAPDIPDEGTAHSPSQTIVRPCLSCRAPFESEGPGNRMCALCRTRDVSPYAL